MREYVTDLDAPFNAERVQLADRDGGWLCFYCETPLASWDGSGVGWTHVRTEPGSPPEHVFVVAPGYAAVDVDHVVPRVRNGRDKLFNKVLACARCNRSKCAQDAVEFLDAVAA